MADRRNNFYKSQEDTCLYLLLYTIVNGCKHGFSQIREENMEFEKMSFEEKKKYLISLIDLLNENQLDKLIKFLDELNLDQEGR